MNVRACRIASTLVVQTPTVIVLCLPTDHFQLCGKIISITEYEMPRCFIDNLRQWWSLSTLRAFQAYCAVAWMSSQTMLGWAPGLRSSTIDSICRRCFASALRLVVSALLWARADRGARGIDSLADNVAVGVGESLHPELCD
jgi:hypothetical protein